MLSTCDVVDCTDFRPFWLCVTALYVSRGEPVMNSSLPGKSFSLLYILCVISLQNGEQYCHDKIMHHDIYMFTCLCSSLNLFMPGNFIPEQAI